MGSTDGYPVRGPGDEEAEAVCKHCLEVFSIEMIKIRDCEIIVDILILYRSFHSRGYTRHFAVVYSFDA